MVKPSTTAAALAMRKTRVALLPSSVVAAAPARLRTVIALSTTICCDSV
jgi:hypothetical protein